MHIEDMITNDPLVQQVKEKPVFCTFILVAAAVLAYLSKSLPQNGSFVGPVMTTVSVIVAIMGLKGVIWPKKHLVYKPTKEKIARREYYFDVADLESVKKCVCMPDPVCCMDKIASLPQSGGTGLRVIIYSTQSGTYFKVQMQRYIPYEYVPIM